MTRIVGADRRPFPLGRELGRGGEGVVFEVTGQPGLVAKLYHEPPSALKQDKLRLMAAGVDDRLRRYAAWPEATLHRESDQAVVGFVMQRIEQRLPIHILYSPAQRRKLFPKARFDFLVFVARNIAAAFDTLHDHGHVLGDVNQGNVLVGADSQVILIDCDSFQVRFGEALHRCEVGVAHFTPPELQRVRAFETTTRTPNHDCFGLALLIFHLLMGGRHPFSGVPQSERVGQALEADIRDFRYAYARDARQRLLLPPPSSVPVDYLPAEVRALFEQAFTEAGVAQRPSAEAWLHALDQLRAQLKDCPRQPQHVYPAQLDRCCWCDAESVNIHLFGARTKPSRTKRNTRTAPDASYYREQLSRIDRPKRLTVPAMDTTLWPPMNYPATPFAIGWLALVGAFILLLCIPAVSILRPENKSSVLVLLMIFGGLSVIGLGLPLVAGHFRSYRVSRARNKIDELTQSLNALAHRVNAGRCIDDWFDCDKKLQQLLDDYQELQRNGKSEIQQEVLESEDLRLKDHLSRFSVETHVMPTLQQEDRELLRELGFRTAAGFSRNTLRTLPGDNRRLGEVLHKWQQQLIGEFYRSGQGQSLVGLNVQAELDRRLHKLSDQIVHELNQLRQLSLKCGPDPQAEFEAFRSLVQQRGQAITQYERLADW